MRRQETHSKSFSRTFSIWLITAVNEGNTGFDKVVDGLHHVFADVGLHGCVVLSVERYTELNEVRDWQVKRLFRPNVVAVGHNFEVNFSIY